MNKKILLVISCIMFIILIQNVKSENNDDVFTIQEKNFEDNFLIESNFWNGQNWSIGDLSSQDNFNKFGNPSSYHVIDIYEDRELPVKITATSSAYHGIYYRNDSLFSVFSAWVLKTDSLNHYFYSANNLNNAYFGGFFFSANEIYAMGHLGSYIRYASSGGYYVSINNNEWYHLIFEYNEEYVNYYIDGNLFISLPNDLYTKRNSVFMVCYTNTATAYFDNLYVGNDINEAFRSYNESIHYVNFQKNLSVDYSETITNFSLSIEINSNVSQSSTIMIFDGYNYNTIDLSFNSSKNCFVNSDNITKIIIYAQNLSNAFYLNISANIKVNYFVMSDIIISNEISDDSIESEFILLITLIALALYTSNKYPNGIMLNAFWLFSISIYGIYVMTTLEEIWFGLIIVLFNAMLQIAFIEKNYRREK